MQRNELKRQIYLQMAKTLSQLGTCNRLKVGCVLLTQEGRVSGVGYNGVGAGMHHCTPEKCGPDKRCLRCVHAECNALSHGSGKPHTAFLTHAPCLNCLREMVLAGVRTIYYEKPYSSMPSDEAEAQKEWIDTYNVWIQQIDLTLDQK